MSVEMLKAADAIERVRSCGPAGRRVPGVDGFQIVPNGHVGRLDLILDLSVKPITAEAAEVAALQFIAAHEAYDVMFEIIATEPMPDS